MAEPFFLTPLQKLARWLVLSSLAAVTALLPLSATAHEIRPAIADVLVTQDRLEMDIALSLEPLVAGMNLEGLADTGDSPEAETYDRARTLTPDRLAAEFRAVWPDIQQDLTVTAGGQPIALTLNAVSVDPVGNTDLPRESHIRVAADLPPDGTPVTIGWAPAFGALIVRQTLPADMDPAEGYSVYLMGGDFSDPIPRTGVARQNWLDAFTNYLILGFEHIVPKGLDHILFVLGLFFFSLHLRPLLYQVSAFTLAHTATLALATLGVLQIPSAIVEPLIAASITYVAVENIFLNRLRPWRTVVVFCFGLLHGLGFAAVLGEIGLNPAHLITGLVAFNIGVELGQLFVIALAFITVGYWFGTKPWYRRVISVPASAAIAFVGAWWFVERALL